LPKEIRYHQNGNIQDLRNLWFQTREDEAKWVAQRIKSLIGTTYIEYNPDGTEKNRRGLTYSDFAVLIRGIRSQNGENKDIQFVNAMRELNIPVKTSGEGGIFDRPYAQCILSIMELLRNGTGVNRIDAEKCFNELVLPIFPEADKNKYFKVLQEWYSNIYAPTTSARRKVYPQNFLHQLADALNLRTLKDETALRDLGLFSDIIKDVEQTYVSIDSEWRYREMLNFLENIAQNYELDSVDYISKVDAVNVSTIHKVKGLEYPVVFVVDLVNQRFPGKRGQYNGILPEELMTNAIDRGAYGNRAEDEARLFYTAITRAERLLYLTGSEIHPGLKTKKKHSVFTADLKHSDMRYDTSLDILADKIEPVPRFDDNELPTDFSSVKSYLTCPFMYKLQNIYGYNAAVPELFGFGQTTHTILERLHQKYKDRIPTEKEIFDIVEDTFMLKHVFPSNDPINRPGSYERAKNLVHEIMKKYVDTYSDDFCRIRQDEARFELLVDEALITGSIDLLLKEDKTKNINAAEVIDFKSMEVPDGLEEFDWREMSLQVQLYSRAAKEVIGENAETGYVHTLKNNKRVEVPVDETAVKNAIGAIEWAVKGILQEDFPMRACSSNCKNCDYRALCRQEREPFKRQELPPVINTPVGERVIAAFEEEDGEF
jgi:DNA helicase-2/ATP-dependent DNA helicase PcrA